MVDDALISAGAGVFGALAGGGAAIAAAALTARQTQKAAIAMEDRDRKRQAEVAVQSARVEAAEAIINDLREMRDVWLESPSKADPTRHDGRLWELHEQVRVRAVILPAPVREDVAVLNRCIRFADEIGGDALRPGGFIFLNAHGVARVAFEAAQERLSRFCAGDKEVPWPPDALRLRGAYDEFMAARRLEYEQEVHEYENERAAFDARHPGLIGKVHNAKQLRGSLED